MENKDWKGDTNSVFKIIAASNHSKDDRQNEDYYATDPIAIDKLIKKYELPKYIYEPCCGAGHLSKRLEELGHVVYSSDLYDRGYGETGIDFFTVNKMPENCNCILTNPPYNKAMEVILHALDILPEDGQCIMLVKTTFLEGKKRFKELFSNHPPKYMFQFVERLICAKNGDFEYMNKVGSAVSYCWMVFTKNNKELTQIDWI